MPLARRTILLSLATTLALGHRLAVAGMPAQSSLPTSGHAPESPRDPAKIVWLTELSEATKALGEEKRPMLVFLTMPHCKYCLRMKSETMQDAKVVSRVNQSFIAAALDGTRNAELARKVGVRIYPTTAVLSADGRLLDVVHGYVDAAGLLKKLEAAEAKVTALVAERQSNQPQ